MITQLNCKGDHNTQGKDGTHSPYTNPALRLPGPGFKQVSTQAILSREGPAASSCSSDKAHEGVFPSISARCQITSSVLPS